MIRFQQYFLGLFLLLAGWMPFVLSCSGGTGTGLHEADTLVFRHATLLKVTRGQGYMVADIRNPWQAGALLHRYVLVPARSALPDSLPAGTLVRTPLCRSVVFTSVHCSVLDDLGKTGGIAAAADVQYILNRRIVEAVRSGRIADAGKGMLPNVEKIMSLAPDAMLVSPFQNSGGYGALDHTGVPLIECADYMETSPLGRAEWMRFFGILYGCERRADSLFGEVEKRYFKMAARVRSIKKRPRVMVDRQEGAAWYVPGGNSTLGRLIADAGGDYVFASHTGSGSVRLAFETVFSWARDTDVWLLKYGAAQDLTYASLREEKDAYAAFRPWKEKKIYGCNTLHVPFFDEEPFHPDRLLADLVAIFHPAYGRPHTLTYYTPIR